MYILKAWVKLMISNFKYGWGHVTWVLNQPDETRCITFYDIIFKNIGK